MARVIRPIPGAFGFAPLPGEPRSRVSGFDELIQGRKDESEKALLRQDKLAQRQSEIQKSQQDHRNQVLGLVQMLSLNNPAYASLVPETQFGVAERFILAGKAHTSAALKLRQDLDVNPFGDLLRRQQEAGGDFEPGGLGGAVESFLVGDFDGTSPSTSSTQSIQQDRPTFPGLGSPTGPEIEPVLKQDTSIPEQNIDPDGILSKLLSNVRTGGLRPIFPGRDDPTEGIINDDILGRFGQSTTQLKENFDTPSPIQNVNRIVGSGNAIVPFLDSLPTGAAAGGLAGGNQVVRSSTFLSGSDRDRVALLREFGSLRRALEAAGTPIDMKRISKVSKKTGLSKEDVVKQFVQEARDKGIDF